MGIDIAAALQRPKIDVHAHVWHGPREAEIADKLVAVGKRLGITEFWCSSPITGGRLAEIAEVRANNDTVLRAMDRYPGVIKGYCYLVPGHYQDAVQEARRCLDAGMIGIKLYNQYKIHDPAVRPVLEVACEYGVPVLEHAAYLREADIKAGGQVNTSHGEDFVAASQRYPDCILIHAHIGGGGDWEWTVKAMADASPNLYCDVSGSNLDYDQVGFAVRTMGAGRVLFGSDGTAEGCLGKVIGAEITEEEREMIYRTNAERILASRKKGGVRA